MRYGFNPRPPLLAGETKVAAALTDEFVFQSTPAITGGRDMRCSSTAASGMSFNPRPPLLAGETVKSPGRSGVRLFQSTPAITGGRDRLGGAEWLRAALFQSTPAITGGRDLCPPSCGHM